MSLSRGGGVSQIFEKRTLSLSIEFFLFDGFPKLIHKSLRYVYVCYAADLAAGGERLLNIVTVVVIAAFSLQFFIIETVVGEGCTQSDRNTIILKHF